jgi:hypothetical protein
MTTDIDIYNAAQAPEHAAICGALAAAIAAGLPGAAGKVWHGGPVWFLAGNPITGYWVRKTGVQLLFWSGQDFDEAGLRAEGKFRAAEVVYTDPGQIGAADVRRWLAKAAVIQWDYKNIVQRKGRLEKLGDW